MNVQWRPFRREGSRPAWAAAGMLLLAGVAAYYNSFQCGFVFDDLPAIVENPNIRDVWNPAVAFNPRQGGLTTSGRPLLNFSFALNYALGGLEPAGYHVTNVAIHLLAGWVLLAVLRRTFLLPPLARRLGRMALPLAMAVTLLWLVHPIQTEAVTYVSQRAESLVTLFYLLTLYCAIRLAGSTSADGWCLGAIVACAAGMATKEVMASAPLLVLLYDRAFLAGSFRKALAWRWRLYLPLAATWAILAYLMSATGERGGTAGFGLDVTWWEYARTQFGVIVHYLKLCFWPSPLCLDEARPVANAWQEIVPPAIVIALLLAAAVWALVRRPMWGVPAALFFLALAPTSSVVPIRHLSFEHRMYLPLAGVVTLVVVGVYSLLQRRLDRVGAPQAVRDKTETALRALVLVLVALLAWQSSVRSVDYRSTLTIWLDTAAKAPHNVKALYSVGGAYMELSQLAYLDARALFVKVRELTAAGRVEQRDQYVKNIERLLKQAAEWNRLSEEFNLRAVALDGRDEQARASMGNTYVLSAQFRRLRGDAAGFRSYVEKAMAEFEKAPHDRNAVEKLAECRKMLGAN